MREMPKMNENSSGSSDTITKKRSSILTSFLRNQLLFLVIIMVVLGVVVTIINPRFLSVQNILNIILAVSVTGIISAGVALLLIMGNFDLSLGGQVDVLGLVRAILLAQRSIALTLVLVILLGMAMGALNGLLVVNIRAHSFIITLAMMSVYKGAALLLSGGKYLSLGGVFPFFKGKLFGIIQYPSIVFVAVILIVFVTLRYLKYGRLLYAIGGNPQAAYLSGVKVKLRRFLGYTFAGGLYGLASIVLISQIGVAYPTTGDAYTLSALAAVVVGGVALTGGRGSALSIFLGVVVFGLIKNSMVIMSVNPYWREIVIGCIILVAVTFSGFATRGE